jgi:hypothetical protein
LLVKISQLLISHIDDDDDLIIKISQFPIPTLLLFLEMEYNPDRRNQEIYKSKWLKSMSFDLTGCLAARVGVVSGVVLATVVAAALRTDLSW